jgi:hypothetical protein
MNIFFFGVWKEKIIRAHPSSRRKGGVLRKVERRMECSGYDAVHGIIHRKKHLSQRRKVAKKEKPSYILLLQLSLLVNNTPEGVFRFA